MSRFIARFFTMLSLFASVFAVPARSQKSLDLNLGLSVSKSMLGVSYTDGRNQLTAGLHGFAYASRKEFILEPGIAYNRYLTPNGFYATAAYTFLYAHVTRERMVFANGIHSLEKTPRKGWESGAALAGLGKSFQFTHWGLHADAGLATPATSDFARAWGWWIGGAASYRFLLD